ncbi:DUF1190 domain-containing protein [Marinicellulosiphila megalodicopiae]|uniref:DUF1190 domain-containing protein n=1 Tax=Marinicellulosiphila megalodicopiae TaxID=2724896 RepID=UPI003BB00AF8
MKRSEDISLDKMRKFVSSPGFKPLVLAIASGAFLISTFGSSKEKAYVASSVDDCVSNTELSQAQCQAAYKSAVEEAAKTAPRFTSQQLCEQDYGANQCKSSGGSFIPFMSGFLVSQVISNRFSSNNPVYRYYGNDSRYRNSYRLGNGSILGDFNLKNVKVPSSTVKSSSEKLTSTIKRSGFGSTSSSKSSWGSSKKSSSSWGG